MMSQENGPTRVSNNSSSPHTNEKERVLKEVGFTSTTFIGPAFPPKTATVKTATVKTDIEDTLSEFYKELKKLDAPDGTIVNPGKQEAGVVQPSLNPKTSTKKERERTNQEKTDNTHRQADTDAHQRRSGQKWPSSYQHEPYNPKRPRSGIDMNSGVVTPAHDPQHYPHPPNRPPNPRFDRPLLHPPPLPSAFLNPPDLPSHINPNRIDTGMINQYRDQPPFPPFSTNECSHPSQEFIRDTPYKHDRDERGYDHVARPDYVNVGWSRDKQEEWSEFSEDFDWRQRFDSENELWERQHHPRPPDNTRSQHSSLVLILMRGLPGSGKSTMARELLSTGPSGLILSTDDYFAYKDGYHYELGLLGKAHEWNQSRAKDAMDDGCSPVIIDNTNIQAWEMQPYVKMALERGYRVDFCEPDTRWKFDPHELEKRNKHGVTQEKIALMMDRFSFPISIDIVMSSLKPPHVNQRRRPEQPQMRNNRDFY